MGTLGTLYKGVDLVQQGSIIALASLLPPLSCHRSGKPSSDLMGPNNGPPGRLMASGMLIGALVACLVTPAISRRSLLEGDHITQSHNCTMSSCFDVNRCPDGPIFYIAPGELIPNCTQITLPRIIWPPQCLLYVIKKYFNTTDDMSKACLFTPGFNTGCSKHGCFEGPGSWPGHKKNVSERVWNLPSWNITGLGRGGANHILLDYNFDWGWPGWDMGDAMIVRSSWETTAYRPEFDVQLPLLQQNLKLAAPYAGPARTDATNFTAIGEELLMKRPLLLYFRGKVYPEMFADAHGRNLVVSLLQAQGHPDVLVQGQCSFRWKMQEPQLLRLPYCWNCTSNFRIHPNGTKEYCGDGSSGPNSRLDYRTGMTSSKFILAPRGAGSLSYRMIEALGSDTIPAVTGDKSVMPFDGEGKMGKLWKDCIYFFDDDSYAAQIPTFLRNVTAEEYGRKLTACRTLLLEHESQHLEKVMLQGLCLIVVRMARMKVGQSPVALAGADATDDMLLHLLVGGLSDGWRAAWQICAPLVLTL